jgi:hypothetical protein
VPGKGEIMGRWMKKIKNKQYGQAMAEFALTIPVFLLLIFGVIELSRFFLVYSSVFTASREASRFGSSVGESGSENFKNCEDITNVAVDLGNFAGVESEDVTIYYESSPGVWEADCDSSLEYKDRYNPLLGDRLVVEIETSFQPILGIIPEINVSAVNGRTIMSGIKRDTTPIPRELCDDYVYFENVELTPDTNESLQYTKLFIEVVNDSYTSNFQIYAIENINWNSMIYDAVLTEINWDGNKIWPAIDGSEYELPINITEEYLKLYNRNLPAKTIETPTPIRLEFVFDIEVNQEDFNLDFDLIMQNSSLPTDFCWPVE